ncbi:MAG TPA: amidase [Thermomicrobiales bacterium]|nr:amidase [Thermomicrobiales bacterium]
MTSDILRLSLSELAEKIAAREISPVEALDACLEQIEAHDGEINAFRVLTLERARQQASEAHADIAAGDYRGPLHGVPIAVKDLVDMRGETTPAGSKVLADRVAEQDSAVVSRLAAAGAVIVGKTHMPEFAYSPGSNNAHYGPVQNPWNRERDTGGSSSGSGAAVAAGMCFGATGSDTGGSIRMPSAFCGLVGIKPTHGLVSAYGAQTLSWSLDHMGPMTRTARDAALMLDAMAGSDPRDSRTRIVPVGDFARALDEGVEGLRVAKIVDDGWDDDYPTPAVRQGVDAGLEALAAAGAEITEIALPEIRDLNTVNLSILNIEAAAYYEPYLRDRWDDVSEWTRNRLIGAYAFSPVDFVRAQQARAVLRARVEEAMGDVDLLALPGVPHEAPPIGKVEHNGRYCGPFNALSWPAIVVPVGLGEHGVPVSLQLVGKPWQDAVVLRAAHAVETHGPWQGRLSPVLTGE